MLTVAGPAPVELVTEARAPRITWSSPEATTCQGTNFATGSAPSGSVTATPSTTTTYDLLCAGVGGNVKAAAIMAVAERVSTSFHVAPPAGCMNLMDHGAVAGGPDTMAAFNSAISAALNTQAKCLYVAAGNFHHSDIIYLRGVSLYGYDPNSSILTATDPDKAAVWDRVGSTIANLQFRSTREVEFNGLPRRDLLFFENASNFRVQNNRFIGPASSGAVKMFESRNGKVIGNYIDNMRAASIYMSGSSAMNNVEIAYNTIRRSRDDNICVESYDGSNGVSNNINIHHNDMADNSWGRGISIVGGHDITIDSNVSVNSAAAGVLVATEDAFANKASYKVTITGNTVSNAGRANGHPGYLLSGGRAGMWINSVRLENNTASDNVNGNFRQEGNVRNVTLSNNSGF